MTNMNTTNRDRARELRKNLTDTERLVWAALRGRRFAGFKFRRQMPLGSYIVDFVCLDRRLVIELDGGQHTRQADYDQRRTEWLRSQGFRVVRFWNHEVLQDWETVAEVIWRELQTPHTPDPSPARGEGRVTDTRASAPSSTGGEGRVTDAHGRDHSAASREGRVADTSPPSREGAREE